MRILIDPGHAPGNANRGQNGYFEFAGMWKLSNFLKNALERYGCIADLTRTEHNDPSLSARGRMAAGYDLFISQHSNAFNGAARGVEVFYSVNKPNDREFAAEMSKAISDFMNNPNRGAKTRESEKHRGQDFYTVMLEAQRAGAIHVLLVESGFHDNTFDEDILMVDDNLRQIAEIQARVIVKYLGGEAETPTTNLTPITGASVATAAQMRAYIKSRNPNIAQSVLDMITIYISEGEIEGIRGDLAFAQSCLETGNFAFIGGTAVTLDQNNFCGMGVTGMGMKGNSYAKTVSERRYSI
jgi:N-acetylmuramoyl-L-alanine amidase